MFVKTIMLLDNIVIVMLHVQLNLFTNTKTKDTND